MLAFHSAAVFYRSDFLGLDRLLLMAGPAQELALIHFGKESGQGPVGRRGNGPYPATRNNVVEVEIFGTAAADAPPAQSLPRQRQPFSASLALVLTVPLDTHDHVAEAGFEPASQDYEPWMVTELQHSAGLR